MQAHKQFKKIKQLALVATTLTSSTIVPLLTGLLPAAQATPVTARRANDFVESVCVNTHLGYLDTPYAKYDTVKQKLLDLGVRHIRDGNMRDDIIKKYQDLATVGIKTNFIMNPVDGTAPNSSYWMKEPGYMITDFVKKVGTNVIDAVEVANEIDLNYQRYYWRKGDTTKLSNDPKSSLYWATYIRSLTKDTWNAIKGDPATAGIKVIGPSLGRTYDYGNKPPLGDLSTVVDWGNVHSYPFGGNSYNAPFAYNTIAKYYYQSNFPSINLDEHPYVFDVYAPPFGTKPLSATETGYFTTNKSKGISEKVHGKYMPRLFLEYFRKGIIRTCSYELLDEWNDPGNAEANFGLLRNDFSAKPAYTALKNLMGRLKDTNTNNATFTPTALDYALTVTPPTGYNRTQYVHSLLLQKGDGKFYLALWHEISNSDHSTTPTREITPPAMPTKVTLNTPIKTFNLSTWNDLGNMTTSSSQNVQNKTINVNVTDKVMVIQLNP